MEIVRVEIRIFDTLEDRTLALETFSFGRSDPSGFHLTNEDLRSLAKGLAWHWSDEVDKLVNQKRYEAYQEKTK